MDPCLSLLLPLSIQYRAVFVRVVRKPGCVDNYSKNYCDDFSGDSFTRRGNIATLLSSIVSIALQWRHNGIDGLSNHQPHQCLLNRLFGRRSKKIWKLRVTGLWVGNSPGTGEFPAQMASNAENASIWWRHHVYCHDICHYWQLCARNPSLTGGFISQSATNVTLWCFLDVTLNKLLNKQSSGRWSETPWRLWDIVEMDEFKRIFLNV